MRIAFVIAMTASVPAFGQMDFQKFPNTALEYKVVNKIPRKLGGNLAWQTQVTVQNTANQAQNFILCLTGKSIHLAVNPQTKVQRTAPVDNIVMTSDAKAKQITCAPAGAPVMKKSRFGNMGCQLASVGAMAQTTITFVTGSIPNPDNATPPVQDGQYRSENGAGFAGPGHRMQTSTLFGKVLPLIQALDSLNLKVILLPNGWDMGCVKKTDVKLGTIGDTKDPLYNPTCATPVALTSACNRCFGMNTQMSASGVDGLTVSNAWVDYDDTIPVPKKAALPLNLDTDFANASDFPCSVALQVNYQPGSGQPSLLSECSSDQPGCYSTMNANGQPFFITSDTDQYDTLTVNFPADTPSTFTADFVVTLQAVSCGSVPKGQIITSDWLRVRPMLMCDINGDHIVDTDDIAGILAAVGSSTDPGSAFDPDGDGMVTIADVRACTLRCTNPTCQ